LTTVGEEITDPPVVNFQAMVRFEGPTAAVEEWDGSARNIVQLLTVEDEIGVRTGGGVAVGAGVAVLEGVGAGVELPLIAQSWLFVEYSVPEVVSTAEVTLPGMMYKLPYATISDSLGAKASIGSVQIVCPL
jgi:hypothetical protein